MSLSIFTQVIIYGGGILLAGIAIWVLCRVGSAAVFRSLEDYQNKKKIKDSRKGGKDGQ